MTTPNWRERFLEIAAGVRQQLGQPAQRSASEPAMPAEFTFSLNGVSFDALHLPDGEIDTHQLLLQCRLGVPDASGGSNPLQLALQANQTMARTRSGVLGLDPATQELVIGMKQSLRGLTVDDLCEGARHMASVVNQWRSMHQSHAH